MPANGRNLKKKSGANNFQEYRSDTTAEKGFGLITDLFGEEVLSQSLLLFKRVENIEWYRRHDEY